MNFKKNILLLLLIIFFITAFLIFKIFIQKGFFIVQGVKAPFKVDFPGFGELSCHKDPCKFSVPVNNFSVKLTKEGYFPVFENFKIPWQKEIFWPVELKKIPILKKLGETPAVFEKKFFPEPPVKNNPFAIRNDGLVFFLDLENGHFFQGTGQDKKLLAKFSSLKELKEVKIFPGKNAVFLMTKNNLFEVSISNKRKFHIFQGKDLKKVFPGENSVFLQTGEEILMKTNQESIFKKVPSSNIDLICSTKKGQIFYIDYQKENKMIKMDFYRKENQNQEFEKIADSLGKVKPEKIACPAEDYLLLILANQISYRLEF